MIKETAPSPVIKPRARSHLRWQRLRHEWRIGQPVLFHHFLIAAAETTDESLWQSIQRHTKNLQLVVTKERVAFLHLECGAAAALSLSPAMALDSVWNAIDPTRLSPSHNWQNESATALLNPADTDCLFAQLKRTGLLPSFIVGALDADHLLYWQQQDTAVLQEADLAHEAGRIELTTLPPARVPLAGIDDDSIDSRIHTFRDVETGHDHLAILIGQPFHEVGKTPLVRLHSSCLTGDVLGSLRCDCGPQLQGAVQRMKAEGGGILLYLNQEGRGIGFGNKMRAYRLQDAGLDTVDANQALGFAADERSFSVAAEILKRLGIPAIRLLTNNPEKARQLDSHNIRVIERVPHFFGANCHNKAYLETKKAKSGHLF